MFDHFLLKIHVFALTMTLATATCSPFAHDTSCTSTNILDVAIIGSGPGGLSAALALSKTQHNNIAVFDRASAFRPIGAALGLNDLGYAALDSLGIADKVRSKAANPKWHLLQRPDGEVLYDNESMFAGSEFTWLGWYTLQSVLRESLPENVSMNLSHCLVDFDEDEENGLVKLHFEVRSDDGISVEKRTVLARTLIGADGYNSIVRQRTVNDGKPNYTGTMTWRGVLDRSLFTGDKKLGRPFHAEGEWGNCSIVGDRKNFWVMDCGNGQIAWTGTALQETSSRSDSGAQQAALKAFCNWPPLVKSMIEASEAHSVVESGVFDRNAVGTWGVSDGKFKRVTLLGDAAHAMRPTLGLGSTMAMQDALSLSEKLVNIKSLDDSNEVATALAAYEQERIEVTAPLQTKARALGEEDSHSEDHADKMKVVLDTIYEQRQAA